VDTLVAIISDVKIFLAFLFLTLVVSADSLSLWAPACGGRCWETLLRNPAAASVTQNPRTLCAGA
jgi:hypothetical protein